MLDHRLKYINLFQINSQKPKYFIYHIKLEAKRFEIKIFIIMIYF